MNRSFLFDVLVMLFAGLILGYCINFGQATNWGASELLTKDNTSSPRRFGDKVTTPQAEGTVAEKTKEAPLHKEESYFLQLSKMDAEEALAEIDRIRNKTKSIIHRSSIESWALSFLYSRLGEKAPRQALEQMKQHPDYFFYINHILLTWAEKNPEAAMNYCLETKKTKVTADFAHVIALTSPEKALEWIKALPKKKRNEAVEGLISGAIEAHPEKIGELIQKAGELVSLDSYLKNTIAEKWIVVDKAAAMKWIDSLPEEEKIEVKARALKELPLEEATVAMASLEGKAKAEAMIQIANSLSRKDPLKAMEWLMTHSDFDLKSWGNIVDSVYFSTPQLNNPALQAYVTKMPAGDKKDIFVEKMVDRLGRFYSDFVEKDMKEVLSFASQISDAEKRTLSIERAIKSWVIESPEEARQWIDNADLPQEKKKQLHEACDGDSQAAEMISE